MSKNKELKEVIEYEKELGFEAILTKKNHYKLVHPKGIAFMGGTISDHRAFQNIRAHLRRITRMT